MNKISKKSVQAFRNHEEIRIDNTQVIKTTNGVKLILFGNEIAKIKDGQLWITTAGWNTRTTFRRLNELPGVNLQTKRGVVYLNGSEWDGSYIQIK